VVMVTEAADVHLTAFGGMHHKRQRGEAPCRTGIPPIHICPYAPEERVSRFGECQRGLVTSGEDVDLDSGDSVVACALQRRALRRGRIGQLGATLIVAPHQASAKDLETQGFGERHPLFRILAESTFVQHSCRNAEVVEAFCPVAASRPSINSPAAVAALHAPTEMPTALSSVPRYAELHVASCSRRAYHRERRRDLF
jgi:hypothetical protein